MSKFGLSDDVYRRMLGDFEKFNKKLQSRAEPILRAEAESKVELSPELRGQTKGQPTEAESNVELSPELRGQTKGQPTEAESKVGLRTETITQPEAEPKDQAKKIVSSDKPISNNIDTLFKFLNKKGTDEIKYKLNNILTILNPGLNLTGTTGTVAEIKPAGAEPTPPIAEAKPASAEPTPPIAEAKPASAEAKPAIASAPSSKKVE
jgi:hypothetical protein